MNKWILLKKQPLMPINHSIKKSPTTGITKGLNHVSKEPRESGLETNEIQIVGVWAIEWVSSVGQEVKADIISWAKTQGAEAIIRSKTHLKTSIGLLQWLNPLSNSKNRLKDLSFNNIEILSQNFRLTQRWPLKCLSLKYCFKRVSTLKRAT